MKSWSLCALFAVGLVACRAQEGANLTDDDAALRRAMADSADWPSYGRDHTNQRYSPLSQINTGTIGGLRLAWHYATGIRQAFEASPVVLGSIMYVSTPLNHIVALNA